MENEKRKEMNNREVFMGANLCFCIVLLDKFGLLPVNFFMEYGL